MSRSFKKTPIGKDNSHGRKRSKRLANKKVRRAQYVASGKQYRKVYNTWNIYDYVSYCSLEGYLSYGHLWRIYKTEPEMIQAWRRSYFNK